MHKIAVIGAGVIGISTALEIQQVLKSTVSVTIFSELFTPNTTGDVSAGLWTPYILKNTSMTEIIKWSKETYDFALKLWQNGEADIAGISLQVMTMLTDNPEESMPEWIRLTLGHCILSREQIVAINREYRANYCAGATYTTFILEPQRLLPYLMEKFKQAGGTIVQRKINCFEELGEFDVIINCAGLQAKQFTNDKELRPVRGQIMRVHAPGQFQIITDNESYIIPNANCVILGGTHQENDSDLSFREKDAKKIREGCRQFSPALESAKLIKHMVGLRPGCSSVTISTSMHHLKTNKKVPIVHNYGHGGSGVTLSIGCAIAARELLQDVLKANPKL